MSRRICQGKFSLDLEKKYLLYWCVVFWLVCSGGEVQIVITKIDEGLWCLREWVDLGGFILYLYFGLGIDIFDMGIRMLLIVVEWVTIFLSYWNKVWGFAGEYRFRGGRCVWGFHLLIYFFVLILIVTPWDLRVVIFLWVGGWEFDCIWGVWCWWGEDMS